jgi:hypothetical protein
MINSLLPPIPDQVRAKVQDILPIIRKNNLKGMICPAGGFTASLFLEGLLSNREIIGLIDNDESKHGTLVAGLPVTAISSIKINPPDFIIVASLSFNKEILAQLLPLSRRYGFKLMDICSSPDPSLHALPFLNSCLPPIPKVIIDNLKKHIPALISNHSRTLLYSDSSLTANLWKRGVFSEINVIGIIDRFIQASGSECHGLRAYTPDQIEMIDADSILFMNPTCDPKITNDFCMLARSRSLQIIDLCEGMTPDGFQSELAESFGRNIWTNRIEEWPTRKVQVSIPGKELCDSLCALSAAREFARRHPNVEVQFQYVPDIIRAYNDDLVRYRNGGYIIPDHSRHFLCERSNSLGGNYQGCFHLSLGLNFSVPPKPELPMLAPADDKKPRSYISLCADVMSSEQLQYIARTAPLPIVCAGHWGKYKSKIDNVEYIDNSPLELLRLIQHAAVVLTNRSAPAHIAAGYNIPSVVWTPGDDYDWHLNYPSWSHHLIQSTDHLFIDHIGYFIDSLINANQVPVLIQTENSKSDTILLR